jgi:hypothetical protein
MKIIIGTVFLIISFSLFVINIFGFENRHLLDSLDNSYFKNNTQISSSDFNENY